MIKLKAKHNWLKGKDYSVDRVVLHFDKEGYAIAKTSAQIHLAKNMGRMNILWTEVKETKIKKGKDEGKGNSSEGKN